MLMALSASRKFRIQLIPGDENFPFITDDNILYFSSNGITGFGGLDIFSVDLNEARLKILGNL
jgi:hypothetical protein